MRSSTFTQFAIRSSCKPREIGILLPNNQRQRRTCYALCHTLYLVSAAHTSILRMDSNSTSCPKPPEGVATRNPACKQTLKTDLLLLLYNSQA